MQLKYPIKILNKIKELDDEDHMSELEDTLLSIYEDYFQESIDNRCNINVVELDNIKFGNVSAMNGGLLRDLLTKKQTLSLSIEGENFDVVINDKDNRESFNVIHIRLVLGSYNIQVTFEMGGVITNNIDLVSQFK